MEVVDYRDMVVIVRDVIADMIKQGMTLDQIKAASPAKPYETQYGRERTWIHQRVCRGHLQKPDSQEIKHATFKHIYRAGHCHNALPLAAAATWRRARWAATELQKRQHPLT